MKKRKHSIINQYTCLFGFLLMGTVVLLLLVNGLVLNKFYIFHKQKVLANSYERVNSFARNESINSDDFDSYFEQLASRNDLEILIMDSDTLSFKASSRDAQLLSNRLLQYLFVGTPDADVIKNEQQYQIQRMQDEHIHLEYLELWGMLSNQDLIVMRTPVESMRESAYLANQLIIVIGLISCFLGFIIVRVASAQITRPIMNLVRISEKMTNLDFSERYIDSKTDNEIALLGDHINHLSGALESTISELKTANVELQQDIERKTEIDEMRKEFVANVSHELKTPIALIAGYAEGLRDCVNDDEESRNFYCDVIADEANKMNTLVKSLLELMQLENGGDSAVMEHFDIVELIYNCVGAMDILAKQSDVKTELPLREPVYVWADELKTEQIFNNYLSNAYHYCKGDRVVKVTLSHHEETLRVCVFNSGDNIPEEELDKLWTKFYKVDKARTREYGGSGIGLSIVKASCDSMNQKYGVENVADGVIFWFEVDEK